jgi:hypothetical protein
MRTITDTIATTLAAMMSDNDYTMYTQVTETVLRCFLGVGCVDRLVLKLLSYVVNVINHTCPAGMDHAMWAQQVPMHACSHCNQIHIYTYCKVTHTSVCTQMRHVHSIDCMRLHASTCTL